MAGSAPASLRDLYTTPSTAWSFVPPSLPQDSNSNSSHPPVAGPSSSGQWATRTAPNPLFELSSSLSGDESGLDIASLAKELLAAALLQYATSALAQPWEVGKTLLQVQWVPRDPRDLLGEVGADAVDDEGELSDSSSNENDSYFADPTAEKPPRAPRPADEGGYIIRQSLLEEGTQPEYAIPVGSADGTWGMMKRLGRFRAEGWLSLWKGLLTSAVTAGLSGVLQPAIYSILQSIFSPLSPYPHPGDTASVLLPVASQVLTGFILSPLDLIRTRLIVQSSVPRHRTYSGPIDAFRQILTHEGGLRGVYLHPHLLIPTLFDCTLRALIAQLLGNVVGALIVLPFETIRHRLQVQTRGTARPLKACVELRPAPYNGMVDAFWHILTEERSDLPVKPPSHKRKRRRSSVKGKETAREREVEYAEEENESWLRHSGIGQLYRGLGMRIGAGAVVFVLSLISGSDEADAGWAEL
ncbi:mitochondrial carrier [Ganoderma leucocontextum]|nr:mitochondrial carrier [Ganoderma leucocontextum]